LKGKGVDLNFGMGRMGLIGANEANGANGANGQDEAKRPLNKITQKVASFMHN